MFESCRYFRARRRFFKKRRGASRGSDFEFEYFRDYLEKKEKYFRYLSRKLKNDPEKAGLYTALADRSYEFRIEQIRKNSRPIFYFDIACLFEKP